MPGLLHPLLVDLSETKESYQMITGPVQLGPHGIRFLLFNEKRPKIPLQEWLGQTLFSIREEVPAEVLDSIPWTPTGGGGVTKEIPEALLGEQTKVTIGSLISEARSQMGAGHFTPTVRETMQATESFIVQEHGHRMASHAKYLMAIAEYIVVELAQQFSDRYGQPLI